MKYRGYWIEDKALDGKFRVRTTEDSPDALAVYDGDTPLIEIKEDIDWNIEHRSGDIKIYD